MICKALELPRPGNKLKNRRGPTVHFQLTGIDIEDISCLDFLPPFFFKIWWIMYNEDCMLCSPSLTYNASECINVT